MSRDDRKQYWGADLPKDSDALNELDTFAEEQGLISRSDATRIILIEWAKQRRTGVQMVPAQTTPVQQSQPLQGQGQFERRRPLNNNASAVELD